MAYFTTYSTAGGGVKMNMGFTETVPKEEVDKDGKHITIENTGDYNCFVRVKAFAPVEVGLTYNAPYGGWTAGDEATGITTMSFRQARQPNRNSISLISSRKGMTNRKNLTS